MLVLISDANVLIDLEVGGIVERIFRLGATIAVPDVLYAEELEEQHPHLVTLGLQLRSLDAAALQLVAGWSLRHRKPSRNDFMAFALALQEAGVLLTGDRDLRAAIEIEMAAHTGTTIEHHGTFWLIERMLTGGVLTDAEAKSSVERMKQGKRRLPWDRFEELMRRRSRKTPGPA